MEGRYCQSISHTHSLRCSQAVRISIIIATVIAIAIATFIVIDTAIATTITSSDLLERLDCLVALQGRGKSCCTFIETDAVVSNAAKEARWVSKSLSATTPSLSATASVADYVSDHNTTQQRLTIASGVLGFAPRA